MASRWVNLNVSSDPAFFTTGLGLAAGLANGLKGTLAPVLGAAPWPGARRRAAAHAVPVSVELQSDFVPETTQVYITASKHDHASLCHSFMPRRRSQVELSRELVFERGPPRRVKPCRTWA